MAIGTVAAAVAAGRYLAPIVPLTLAVPLLLLAAPRLTRLFSDGFVPRLWSGAISGTFNLDWITSDYVLWGILSNESQKTDFLVLCTNTMHKVADTLEQGVDLPLLHIGDTTATAVAGAGVQRVGLLGTGFTMAQPFYADRLRSTEPSPRTASLIKNGGEPASRRAVGWNW